MENYKAFPIQNIIASGNIENSLNRILQMQKSSGIGFVHPTTVMTPPKIVDEMLNARTTITAINILFVKTV